MFIRILMVMAVVITACTPQSTKGCATADWEATGWQDGLKGHSQERLTQHNQICATQGVTPDWAAWDVGYLKGLHRYCAPQNLYKMTSNGQKVKAKCPASVQRRKAVSDGDKFYLLSRQIWDLEAEIDAVTQDRRSWRKSSRSRGLSKRSFRFTQRLDRLHLALVELEDLRKPAFPK